MKNIFTRTRNMKWVMKSGMILSACMILTASPVLANREPVFTSDYGGTKISCSVYKEQVKLSGVKANDTIREIKNILGEPSFVDRRDHNIMYSYRSLRVYLVDFGGNGGYTVDKIESSTPGAFTPDGVGVGMSESVLSDVYGTADSVCTKTYNFPKLSDELNQKNQGKLNETIYTYNANEGLSMSFTVKNGIIKEISIFQDE